MFENTTCQKRRKETHFKVLETKSLLSRSLIIVIINIRINIYGIIIEFIVVRYSNMVY